MAERPVRIQRKRTKGFDMQKASPNGLPVVYVGRPTKWGNPFSERTWGLELAIALFRDACDDVFDPGTIPTEFEDWRFTDASQIASAWRRHLNNLYSTASLIQRELRGKNLACWCPLIDKNGDNVPCHADVLLELANETERVGRANG